MRTAAPDAYPVPPAARGSLPKYTARCRPVAFWLALLVTAAAPGNASWTVTTRQHPEQLADVQMATDRNEGGFRLSVTRSPSGGARLLFELSRDPEFLDEQQGLQLTIDNGPRRQLPRASGSITWVELPIWEGTGAAELGVLRDLMEGREVTIDYFLNRGGYKSTTFDLEGLAGVAAELLGVPARVSAEQKQLAADREALLLDAGAACARLRGRKKRDKCLDEARTCLESAGDDLEALRSCLGL